MKTKILFIACLISLSFLKAQTISTIAGTWTAQGYAGNGGQAKLGLLNNPNSIVIDTSGNIYFTEEGNHIVRKINTSGIISTIAGTDTAGYNGDNILATSARLNSPNGLALDVIGNLYIADAQNQRVRMVNTSGVITTVAGTGVQGNNGDGITATTAQLNFPSGVVVDNTGNIYISDLGANTVRIVRASTGIINTYAGTPYSSGYSGDNGSATSAKMYHPHGLAIDGLGNLYIADSDNSAIRKISSSGIITTVAGNGTYGYSGDNGPAISAQLSYPPGITIDAAGNLYISEKNISVVRKVNTSGIITTIAGNGSAGHTGDGGLPTNAQLGYPTGAIVDVLGNIYIADWGNNEIRKICIAPPSITVTGNTTICAGSSTILNANGALIYSWNTGATTSSISVSPSTNLTDTVIGTDAGGCMNKAIVTVTVNPLPILTINSPTICIGATTTLTANGALTYTWSNASNTSVIFVNPTSTTIYTVTGTDTHGCIDSTTTTVVVNSLPIINISGNTTFCSGSSSNLSVSGASTYTWLPATGLNTTMGSNVIANPTVTTTYTITGANSGCSVVATGTAMVNVNPLPSVTISINPSSGAICLGNTATLTANGASTYTWNTTETGAIITPSPTIATSYTVTGTDINGCNNTATGIVSMLAPQTPYICMVSTDSFFVNNVVYWDRTLYAHVDSFIVYRLSAGVYLQIGATSKDSNQLTDTKRNIGGPNGGDPNISSWYYKIAIKDTCGNISPMSPYHETVNFQQNNQNLTWNAYVIESPQTNPVNNYEVWRDSLGIGDWHIFVNTSGLSTNDPSYLLYPNANYRVDATPFGCTANERLASSNNVFAAKVKSHSNINNNRHTSGINKLASGNEVSIYPNPNNGSFQVSFAGNSREASIYLYDVNGKLVLSQSINSKTTIDASSLSEGVYNLCILNNEEKINKKLVIVK